MYQNDAIDAVCSSLCAGRLIISVAPWVELWRQKYAATYPWSCAAPPGTKTLAQNWHGVLGLVPRLTRSFSWTPASSSGMPWPGHLPKPQKRFAMRFWTVAERGTGGIHGRAEAFASVNLGRYHHGIVLRPGDTKMTKASAHEGVVLEAVYKIDSSAAPHAFRRHGISLPSKKMLW